MSRHDTEKGSAVLIALLMLLGLVFVGAALVVTTSADLKIAGEDRRGTQAEFVAEAGIQEAMHRLSLAPGKETVTVDGQTFDPSIRDASDPPDPNWEARIYVPGGTPPVNQGAVEYLTTVQSTADLLNYTSGDQFLRIHHKWRDRDGDGVRDADEIVLYDPGKLPPENFDTGRPIEVVDVEGHRAQARRRLQVEATRFPFYPNVMAALCSNEGVDVRGNVSICGHDHRADTPVNTTLVNPCSPNYDMGSGYRPAITTTGDPIDRSGSTDLLGSPVMTDTSSTNPFYTLAECLGVTQDVIDQVLANPDHTSTNDDPLEGITYVQGDAHLNNSNGQGLLYVTGDLDMSGNCVWKGLIYVEGDLHITGTPWILGAVVVRGSSDYAFSGGDPAILYSSEMLRLALESAFKYVVISWKEM